MNSAISADSRSRTCHERADVIGLKSAAFHAHDDLARAGRVHVVEEFQPVNAAVRALLFALEGLGSTNDTAHHWNWYLSRVARSRAASRSLGVPWTSNLQAGLEGVLEPFFDERNGEVRDVDADPLAVELLRGVNGRAATAERVEHHVAFVAAGGNDAFQQEPTAFASGSREFFACGNMPNVIPNRSGSERPGISSR